VFFRISEMYTLGQEVKLQPGVVSGLMYGTKARCYLNAHEPTAVALVMTVQDTDFLADTI
jgi:hypothetical protein